MYLAPSGSEITDEQHCPKAPEKPTCGGCPETNIHECDNVIYCRSASKEEYARAAFQFNTAMPMNPRPCVVVMANNKECIKAAMKYANHHHLPIAVRGGRHSYIGASTADDGMVVDVSRIDHVQKPDLESYNHHCFLENYRKLVEVKKKYDLFNVFKYSQSIPLFLKVKRVLLHLLPYIAVIVLLTITVLLLLHHLCRDRGHTHRRKKQS